jgi:hypothetical protein
MYSVIPIDIATRRTIVLNDNCLFDSSTNEYKHDTDVELANKITKLAGHINAAAYRFLKMLAEFNRRQGWVPS